MEIITSLKALEVIIISLGGILCIYLGYRILIAGTRQPFTIFSDLKGWKFKAANIAPGIFFAIIGSLVLFSPIITNLISILQKERFINTYATKLILDELRKKNNIILDYRLNNKTYSPENQNKNTPTLDATVKSKELNKAIVTCNVLRLRKEPGIHNQIIGRLRKGDIITVKATKGLWLRVSTDEFVDGWVHGNYIKRLAKQRAMELRKSPLALNSNTSDYSSQSR